MLCKHYNLLSGPRVRTTFAALPTVVSVLQPPLYETRSHLAFATLPLPIPFVIFSKLTASSRFSAPPDGLSRRHDGYPDHEVM